MKKCKIYINGKLIGACEDPETFVEDMREKRRNGEVSHEMNITHYPETDEIFIFNDPGRTRRPLIVVKDGESMLKEEHIDAVEAGEMKWDDFINPATYSFSQSFDQHI